MVAGLLAQPTAAEDRSFERLKRTNDPPRHIGKPPPKPPRIRYAKPTDPMKALRTKVLAGDASYAEMRRLAESGDDLGAFYLAKSIEEAGDPAEFGTAGYFYMLAVRGGRSAAVKPLVRLLEAGALVEQPKNTAESEALLAALAAKGDAAARDGLISMYRKGTPFGPQPEKAQELLVAAADAGDSKAAFDLAVSLLGGTLDPAAKEKARTMLEVAAASEDLSIRTMAENMLRNLYPQLTASTETVQ
jgi:hypothetical protein